MHRQNWIDLKLYVWEILQLRAHTRYWNVPRVGYRLMHDELIKWKNFPRHWPFLRGIHWSPVNSLHKGQWRGALMFSLICAWIHGWVNNGDAGDLRRHRAHYDGRMRSMSCMSTQRRGGDTRLNASQAPRLVSPTSLFICASGCSRESATWFPVEELKIAQGLRVCWFHCVSGLHLWNCVIQCSYMVLYSLSHTPLWWGLLC